MNAIILVVDRLSAGQLGAYGNSWVETPELDRLACESFLLDQFVIDSPRLESLYRSFWQGLPALACDDGRSGDDRMLAALLGRADVATTLLTDEPSVAAHPAAASFDTLVELSAPDQAEAADSIEQTHLAEFLANAIDLAQDAADPFLLWCHTRGLGAPWDAPWELRRRLAEADDPQPPRWTDVPNLRLDDDYDPDQLLGILQAYAGQVAVLDVCVGALVELLLGDSDLGANTLLVLLSPRGFPLGEHHRVGTCDDALHGELVHVPMMVRFPDGLGAAARSQALIQPADIWATLLSWWKAGNHLSSTASRDLAELADGRAESFRDRISIVGHGGERAIRTPAWYLRDGESGKGESGKLFAKPDDRWEVNDVAGRHADLVDSLRAALSQHEQAARSGTPDEPPRLSDLLRRGFE